MNKPTKFLVLENIACDRDDGPPGTAACAVLAVAPELVALCRRRIEAAESVYAQDASLVELRFLDSVELRIFGDDLLDECGRKSDEFHDAFVNHCLALLPESVNLDAFQPIRAESHQTVIRLDPQSAPYVSSIEWAAVVCDTAAPIKTADVRLEYLEQILATDEPAGCDCEAPGYYRSGVPGILAHMRNGRLASDAIIERCESCQRYPSDATALNELRRRGLA